MPAGTPVFDRPSSASGQQNSSMLIDLVAKLKQELMQSRSESQRLTDQLNCLLSLIKRSWSGDHNATCHLANIVGVPPPEYGGGDARLRVPDTKTRAERNWERLTLKLLDQECAKVEQEIQERQRLYIQNRNMYMEEVMDHHQVDMSRYHLHKHSSKLEEIDCRFIRTHNKQNVIQRPPSGNRPPYRARSAVHRPPRTAQDMVENADITLGELFVQPGQRQREFASTYKLSAENEERYKNQVNFDDPKRYRQVNLFNTDAVFGPDGFSPKKRPVSAAVLRQKDQLRARPKSAVFLTQKNERPLKYETTRPVSSKPASRLRRNSGTKSMPDMNAGLEQNQQQKQNYERPMYPDSFGEDADNSEKTEEPPLTERINQVIKKPESVVKFEDDLKNMNQMEEDFKKSTLQLQKKLGIMENGMV